MAKIAWEAATLLGWVKTDFPECQAAMDHQVETFESGLNKLVLSQIVEKGALYDKAFWVRIC